MAQETYDTLREFEEKIIDITCDNLEIITGQQIQIVIDHIEAYSESIPELLMPNDIRGTIEFSNDGYVPWTLYLPSELGGVLASTMLGEEPSMEFNTDEQIEPLQELFAQIMSPYLSELSSIEGEQVDASEINVVHSEELSEILKESIIVSYQVTVGPDQQFQMYKIVPDGIMAVLERDSGADQAADMESGTSGAMDAGPEPEMSDAQFQQFSSSGSNGNGANLDMLMDLEMPITIELGRTKLTIKNILKLGQGSIIELDKLSGDPVDVYINDRKFAEGEVVVVDENFGVRITEIVSPVEKIKSLQ